MKDTNIEIKRNQERWSAHYNNVIIGFYKTKKQARQLAPKRLQQMLNGYCTNEILNKLKN